LHILIQVFNLTFTSGRW